MSPPTIPSTDRALRVLLAHHRYFTTSGAERYLFNVQSELEARGHSAMPFSIRYAKNEPSPYENFFVPPLGNENEVYFSDHTPSLEVAKRTLGRLVYSRTVERAVNTMVTQTRPDVAYILCYLRKLSPALLVGLAHADVPIVVRISDYGMMCPEQHFLRDRKPCTECLGGTLWPSVRHGCVKSSRAISLLDAAATSFHRLRGYFDLIDAFVVTNSFMKERMQESGIPAEKIHCIPTFTDTSAFSPSPSIVPTRPVFAVIGRLDETKGIHILIDALEILRKRLPRDVPMVRIAGSGHDADYVALLHRRVAELGLEAHIEWMGHCDRDAIIDLLRGSVATVVPSLWYENLPNALIESLACGTPVVTSDIGSLRAAISDGRDGVLVPPGDARALAEALAGLLSNPTSRDQMAKQARLNAVENHSPGPHLDQLIKLLRSVRAPDNNGATGSTRPATAQPDEVNAS